MRLKYRLRELTFDTIELAKRLLLSKKYRSKIKQTHIKAKHKALSAQTITQARLTLRRISENYNDLRWHAYYKQMNGIESAYYIPEDLFFCVVERSFNPPRRAEWYLNKNRYEGMGFSSGPKIAGHIVRGRLVDAEFYPISSEDFWKRIDDEEVIIKPSLESGGGGGVEFVKRGTPLTSETTSDKIAEDRVIQRLVRSHTFFHQFNPTSLNTLRVMTIRKLDGSIQLVSSVLRCGRSSMRVDNQAAGGLALGIDRDGRLNGFGIDKFDTLHREHPDSRISFQGDVPGFMRAVDFCREMHRFVPDLDLVSWDVAISPEETPILIECNVIGQELNFHQVCNGPVFEAFLPEVLRRAKGKTLLGFSW